jgi:uncharacterized protein YybS (DUF2232 family)
MVLLACVVLIGAILLAAVRFGARYLLPVALVVSAGVGILLGPVVGLAPLMGLVAAIQVERQRPYSVVVAAAVIPAAFLSAWLLLIQDQAGREALIAEITAQLQGLGLGSGEGDQALRQVVAVVARVQPGIEFLALLLAVVLGYWVSSRIGDRLEVPLPARVPFRCWRPWDELIWVAIVGLGLGLVGDGLAAELGLNLLLVMVVLYAVQGLALMRFLAWRRGIPRWLEALFYVTLLLAAGIALVTVAGLGLLDTWFDWRRLRPAEVPGETDG